MYGDEKELNVYIVKPVNKGHPMEKQNLIFIDKWSLYGGYIAFLSRKE